MGTGLVRVWEWLPVPLPHRTLPATRAGFQTRGNPYETVSRWLVVWFFLSFFFDFSNYCFQPLTTKRNDQCISMTKRIQEAVGFRGLEMVSRWLVSSPWYGFLSLFSFTLLITVFNHLRRRCETQQSMYKHDKEGTGSGGGFRGHETLTRLELMVLFFFFFPFLGTLLTWTFIYSYINYV